LRELNLTANTRFSFGIKDLVSLTKLNLSSNCLITKIELQKLTNLQALSLQYNRKVLDNAVKQMTQLKSLDLRMNAQITNGGISNLFNLDTLFIDDHYKRTLEAGVKRLTNLTHLTLNGNHMYNAGISKLIKLRELSLSRSTYITIQGLSNLSDLTTLTLRDCVSFVSYYLHQMTNITSLSLLSDSHPYYIPTICLSKLMKLSTLHFGGFLNIDDNVIKNFLQLTDIHVHRRITDEGIKDLTNLVHLKLCDIDENYKKNKISDIGIKKLTNLQSISNWQNSLIMKKALFDLPNLIDKSVLNIDDIL
jgi:hypothetical protein